MKSILKSLGVLLIFSTGTVMVRASSPDDSDVYNEIVTISGKVQFINHAEFGKLPASGQYLVFQRVGCKLCLIATHADENGNYKIRVGRGRYKIIVHNPSPPTYDMLAPGQARYVTATALIEATDFDIDLRIGSRRQ